MQPEMFSVLTVQAEQGNCGGCRLPVSARRTYHVPKLPGVYCSIACVETQLFDRGHCRWCGEKMERTYTGIESRLCGEDCGGNYFAHVMGDYSAELGTGQRLLLWLERNQPAVYRQVIGGIVQREGFCQNPLCPRGERGSPASLAHLRAGSRFCCDACKKQSQRSPNLAFPHAKNALFIEVSRDESRKLDSQAIPTVLEHSAQ